MHTVLKPLGLLGRSNGKPLCHECSHIGSGGVESSLADRELPGLWARPQHLQGLPTTVMEKHCVISASILVAEP